LRSRSGDSLAIASKDGCTGSALTGVEWRERVLRNRAERGAEKEEAALESVASSLFWARDSIS